MKRAVLVFALALAIASLGNARADEPPPDEADPAQVFGSATVALGAGRASEAIAKYESLSDRGVVDPVLSYDRGLAYAERVRASAEQPGDLGRAVHGFEEASTLTHDSALEADATRALAAVRAEIAKRRSRTGESSDLEHGVSLGRSITSLLPENTWAILAALFSAVLTAGLVFRARAEASRARVAGTTTCVLAAGLLAVCAIELWLARDARLHLREGVVVATSRLLDDRHVALDGAAPVIEGARVTITDDGPELTRVRTGRMEGWLPASSVLPLAKR
ncbi:MAG TPA: hypothetical protein VIF62_16110 [Labilithrix sp.]